MTETRNSSVKQKPHIPTISRMKKPPVSRGPACELGCCRGTYPPPAAGCMVTALRWTGIKQKSRTFLHGISGKSKGESKRTMPGFLPQSYRPAEAALFQTSMMQ